MLQQLVPKMEVISLLINPDGPTAKRVTDDVQTAASKLGLPVRVLAARNEQELLNAVSLGFEAGQGRALLVGADPFFLSRRALLISLIMQAQIPAIYDFRDYADAGGLMSYGPNLPDIYRQSARLVGRILKGEKPGDLPFELPTRYELIVNLKTAKAMGLTLPNSFVLLADEVIE